MVRERICRGQCNNMRGPSGGGRPKNWRSQGPNFGPILAPPSTSPRSGNQMQRVIPRRTEGSGIGVNGD